MVKSLADRLKRIIIVLICILGFAVTIFNPVALKDTPKYSCSKNRGYALPSIGQIFKTIFNKNDAKDNQNKDKLYIINDKIK